MNVNIQFELELFLSTERWVALMSQSQQRVSKRLCPEESNHNVMDKSDGHRQRLGNEELRQTVK